MLPLLRQLKLQKHERIFIFGVFTDNIALIMKINSERLFGVISESKAMYLILRVILFFLYIYIYKTTVQRIARVVCFK